MLWVDVLCCGRRGTEAMSREQEAAISWGGGDVLCGLTCLDITDPPTDAEVVELALYHVVKTRLSAQHTKQLVPVDASAAPCQVVYELMIINPELDLAMDSDGKRFEEKWDSKVCMGWPTPAADMMTKYRTFKATEPGAAAKFSRVTFTQLAAGGVFQYRL